MWQLSARQGLSLGWIFAACGACGASAGIGPAAIENRPDGGLLFNCPAVQIGQLEHAVDEFLAAQGVKPELVLKTVSPASGTLQYGLVPSQADGNTLDLIDRPALGLTEELLSLPAAGGKSRTIVTVARSEILYALLQSGRATRFEGAACSAEALKDEVGIRQNIVAWAESLEWHWPDGERAKWNTTYWRRGTPVKGHALHVAVNDAFVNQPKYSIGCYTATKLVMLQGVLDYYHRIKRDPAALRAIEDQLLQDGEPLVSIEPGAFWSFERGTTPEDLARKGKLFKIQSGVGANNFVPGDWSYFLNTDPVTYEKTGYEGSNAIYLGRNKFDDYYNDHGHSYSHKEKLHEVFQWRNGVFSASRDVAKVKPLSINAINQLKATPEAGGVQLALRAVPLLYGHDELPRLKAPATAAGDTGPLSSR